MPILLTPSTNIKTSEMKLSENESFRKSFLFPKKLQLSNNLQVALNNNPIEERDSYVLVLSINYQKFFSYDINKFLVYLPLNIQQVIQSNPEYFNRSQGPFNIRLPSDWLSFQAYCRTFHLEPFSAFDHHVLVTSIVHKQLANANTNANTNGNANANGNGYHEDNDNCSSISITSSMNSKRKLPGLGIEEGLVDPLIQYQKVFKTIMSDPIRIPSNARIFMLLDIIHEALSLPTHPKEFGDMIFYIVYDYEYIEEAMNALPIVPITDTSIFLEKYFPPRKKSHRSHHQLPDFKLIIRLSPFLTVINDKDDLKEDNRFLEVIILDEGLRSWRRLFINKLKASLVNSSDENKRTKSDEDTITPIWLQDSNTSIPLDFLNDSVVYVRSPKMKKLYEEYPCFRQAIGLPDNLTSNGSLSDSYQYDALVKYEYQSRNEMIGNQNDFTLLVVFIINNIVFNIFHPMKQIGSLPCSWLEGEATLNNLYSIGIQHVPLHDVPFLYGVVPKVKSTIVSVFSFTLLGNATKPCSWDENLCYKPLITFIREDDDYDSLCRRICTITGESIEESLKYRLAVVDKKIPYFISKQSQGLGLIQENVNDKMKDYDKNSVWELLKVKYPLFVEQSFFDIQKIYLE